MKNIKGLLYKKTPIVGDDLKVGDKVTNEGFGGANKGFQNYTTDKLNRRELVSFDNKSNKGEVIGTLGDRADTWKYANEGKVTTSGLTKNNVLVSMNGTPESNAKRIKKVNRLNWLGANGFRGKGWSNGMNSDEKSAFRKSNPIYMKGRSRRKVYEYDNTNYVGVDAHDISRKADGSINNNTSYTYNND